MLARAGRPALIVLDVIIGLLGIGGGIATATGADPFPQEWIAGTPFNSYLIPGIILTLAVGGAAAAAAVGMLRRAGWGPLASVFAGTSMIGFLVGEILILNQPVEPTVTEMVFFAIGAAMVVLGLVVRRSCASSVTAPG
ncbi:MAG: hypothetical protein JXA57_16210 [Armatimonadetes bacterium]|nr:hypothetical protein [Armatimonadota bacterium]